MAIHNTTLLRPNIKEQWLETCRREAVGQNHVIIDTSKLDVLINDLKAVREFTNWRNYVGPVDPSHPDLHRLAYEMALTTGMIGGYITVDEHNRAHKWHVNGSGSDAMFSMLDKFREIGALPDPANGKVYGAALRAQIQPILTERGVPLPDYRLAVYEELGNMRAYQYFGQLISDCIKGNQIIFDCEDVQNLAREFPTTFGGDELNKKASLYFLFMSLALNELGQSTKADILAPSEYRMPQVFMAYGIFKPSTALKKKLRDKTPLAQGSEEVRVLRMASILVVEEIMKQTGLPLQDVDAALYNITKTKPFLEATRAQRIEHMMVPARTF